MKWLAPTALAPIALVACSAAPLPPVMTGAACTIEGWSVDPDPTGLRVRAAPDAKASEVGRLPAFVRSDDGDYGPAFAIVGARNGWLRIRDARDTWAPSPRPTYSGSGWVHGSRVRLAIQSGHGLAAPRTGSASLIDTGEDWISDVGQVRGVVDCAGSWAKVAYTVPAGPKVHGQRNGNAWVTDICGDQRTTCDLPPAPTGAGKK